MVFGTAAEAADWVGRRSAVHAPEVPVNEAMVFNYCALLEDSNPRFWRGGESPPGMMQTWGLPLVWRPETDVRPYMFALEVPLPGTHIINTSVDVSFLGPVRFGDHVEMQETIVSISPEKNTRLGAGHFITTLASYFVAGDLVATAENVLFRYLPA